MRCTADLPHMTDTSLNLLPPSHKADIRSAAIFLRLQTIGLVACGTAVVIAIAVGGAAVLVRNISNDFTARSTDSSREFDVMMAEVRAINGYLKNLDDQRPAAEWSEVLLGITELAPADVRIASVRGEADGTIHVIGSALTRDSMLAMRAALEDSPQFGKVDSPLSNLLQQRDVSFEFVLTHEAMAAAASSKKPAVRKK